MYLDVASVTIYRWLEKGRIPAHRVGKQWRFKPSEIDEWVRSGKASDNAVEQGVQLTNPVDHQEQENTHAR